MNRAFPSAEAARTWRLGQERIKREKTDPTSWYRAQAERYGEVVKDEYNDIYFEPDIVYRYARLAGHFGRLAIITQALYEARLSAPFLQGCDPGDER